MRAPELTTTELTMDVTPIALPAKKAQQETLQAQEHVHRRKDPFRMTAGLEKDTPSRLQETFI
jgi:hypothetical protein